MTPKQIRALRDMGTWAVAILGIVHETVISKVDRPYLLFLFGAMLGLPVFFRRDEGSPPPAGGT